MLAPGDPARGPQRWTGAIGVVVSGGCLSVRWRSRPWQRCRPSRHGRSRARGRGRASRPREPVASRDSRRRRPSGGSSSTAADGAARRAWRVPRRRPGGGSGRGRPIVAAGVTPATTRWAARSRGRGQGAQATRVRAVAPTGPPRGDPHHRLIAAIRCGPGVATLDRPDDPARPAPLRSCDRRCEALGAGTLCRSLRRPPLHHREGPCGPPRIGPERGSRSLMDP